MMNSLYYEVHREDDPGLPRCDDCQARIDCEGYCTECGADCCEQVAYGPDPEPAPDGNWLYRSQIDAACGYDHPY